MSSRNTASTAPDAPENHPARDVILAQIDILAHRLAEARQQCAECNATLDNLFDHFYAEPHVQAVATKLHDAQIARDHAEQELRTAMVAAYQILGTNRLDSVGEIRLMHEIVYYCSDQELLATMKTQMPDVVIITEQVERRKLEKRLRTEPDTHIPGVQVRLTPKAFINADLSELLHQTAAPSVCTHRDEVEQSQL